LAQWNILLLLEAVVAEQTKETKALVAAAVRADLFQEILP
jgi:hypothetical protein